MSGGIISRPESVSIRKCSDGTYIFYALVYVEAIVNGIKERSLCSMKSSNLIFEKEIGLDMEFRRDYFNYGFPKTYQELYSKSLVYNLSFKSVWSRGNDVLVELMVLNKGDGVMAYNIFETPENYEVQMNLPGFTSDEVSIYLENGTIRVKAKPKAYDGVDEGKEVVVRNFVKWKEECEIYLPNSESAEAELKNGILYINVPKKTKGVKVQIKTA